MGRRTVLPKFQVYTNADTTTDPVSTVSDVSGVDYVTYQLTADASVNASLTVEFCNDDRIDANSVFKALDFGQTTPIIGATDAEYLVHVQNRGFRHLKLSLTNNAGTGNVNAWVSGTAMGA